MGNSRQELSPSDWQVELVPFEELEPYNGEDGLYELDTRDETGYKVVLLYQKAGDIVLSRVVKEPAVFQTPVFEIVEASNGEAVSGFSHTFPSAPKEKIEVIFPKAA